MIWKGGITPAGNNATVNSEDLNNLSGTGSGSYWGFELNDATLTSVELKSGQFED